MAVYYDLQSKSHYNPRGDRFKTKQDACAGLKKRIREQCDITRELEAIGSEGLPAPKYRASVCKYLETFFCTGGYPSPDIIDFSDYEGLRRSFPPEMDPEEAQYATGYEKHLGIPEYYDSGNITEYDRRLGFVFSVGESGMQLRMIGSLNNLRTHSYFLRCGDTIAFGFEPFEEERCQFDARIFRSEGELPPKLTGSFYRVMLLTAFLDGIKCPIKLPEAQLRRLRTESADDCLIWKLEDALYQKMNDGFILPSEIRLSESTVERYICALNRFGYTVKKQGSEYYLPPFICEKDER